ncbi:hypothetical protein ACFL6C_05020, partial [Myxococcota bacterium]
MRVLDFGLADASKSSNRWSAACCAFLAGPASALSISERVGSEGVGGAGRRDEVDVGSFSSL